MLQAFNKMIKPLNDALGQQLGIKKIEVKCNSHSQKVPVKVGMLDSYGNIIFVSQHNVEFYLALGLSIRKQYE